MPALIRRHPSVDLRKAARLAELATKSEIESFSLEEDMESLYRSKTQTLVVPHPTLRLTTSSPILSSQYQSDEEQPSPHTDEFDESGLSEYASCEDEVDDMDFDGDDEGIDFEIEEIEHAFISSATAISIPFQSVRPSLVDISVLAPMAKRSVPISRPQSASYATFIRVKAPAPTEVRVSSIYSSSPERPVRNFSTPLPRSQSLSPPASLHSGTSPSSSCLSLSNGSFDGSEAMIRDSDEIEIRSTVLAGTEWEDPTLLESPTPTSWAAYDPFALSAPTLGPKVALYHQTISHEDNYEKPRGWKRLGFRSKLLSAGKRVTRN